jgi:hypothetical protein
VSAREKSAEREWPRIGHALEAETYLPYQMGLWHYWAEQVSPAEVAAGYEEWADYFEYRLADELATDPSRRYLMETWTDSMVYLCRRRAARARGEDPGEWVPQHKRRPDIVAPARVARDTGTALAS